MFGKSPAYDNEKEKVYASQLSKISEVDDDLFSTNFSQNINYGIIPLNALNNIMLFQQPPDLLSMSLSCSLFCRAQNSSYFWKTYHSNFFKTDIESKICKVNWKKEFVLRYFDLVYTWGIGKHGVLGHGNTESERFPKYVEKLVPFRIKNVFCGYNYSCSVVISNGELLSWGWNAEKRLGHEEAEINILSPELLVQLPENRKIIQVAHSDYSSLFLDDFGDIWGCGSNDNGVLTGRESDEIFDEPVKIKISGSNKIIKKIVSGEIHFGCICSSGNLYCWGDGDCGQLGHTLMQAAFQPTIVQYFENIRVKDVSMGEEHTLVLSEDGKLYSFGRGDLGQLGNGKTDDSSSPEIIKYFCENNIIVSKISCGECHSGCLDSVGNCYVWGYGGIGIGKGSFRDTPIRISSFMYSFEKIKIDLDIPNRHRFIKLECGSAHNIALLEESTANTERKTIVLTWGSGLKSVPKVVPFFENVIVKSVHCRGATNVAIL